MCVPVPGVGTGSFDVVGLFETKDAICSGNGSTAAFLSGDEQHVQDVQDDAVAVRLRESSRRVVKDVSGNQKKW